MRSKKGLLFQGKKNWLFLAILIFVFWSFIGPGPRVGGDFPYSYSDNLRGGFGFPQAWSSRGAEGLGEYVVATLWSWPNNLLYSLGGRIGFSFDIVVRLTRFFPILLIGTIGINKLLIYLGVKNWGRWFGALFYLLNTYILLLIDGGQFAIGLAYAWMPIAYLALEKSLKGKARDKILAGLAVSVLGYFDIRFVFVLLIIIMLRFIYNFLFERSVGIIYGYISSGLIIVLIFAGLNAYWLLTTVYAQAPALPAGYQRISQASFLSFANIGHSLFLLQPHWFVNIFGKITELKASFVLIPILVFLAPLLKRKSKVVGFWLLVALIGVFLVKGANPPLPGVYPWLFTNVPGFSLFRDPTKFFFLIALSYSVLIGITVDELTKKFNWKLKILNWKIALIPLVLAVYFVWLVRPVWLGQMTGTFTAPVYQDEYLALADKIKSDKDFGRVFWIPTKAPLGFSSPTHPSVEASRLVQKRPFAIGTVGTYEVFNYLREAPFMGELFDVAGIKYIAYPFPDTRREDLKQDNIDYYNNFSEQIKSLDWVDDMMIYHQPVNVFKTSKNADRFFLAENTFFIVGSDRIYWDLTDIDGFDLSNNALIFAEEQPELGNEISDYINVILYENEPIGLAATFIDESNFIFPADNLEFDPNNSGWWKRESTDLISWRDFLQQKYGIDNLDLDFGGGWAIAEGKKQLTISNKQLEKNDILLARVMSSSKGGKLEFYQADVKVGEINTTIDSPERVEVNLTGYGEIPDQSFEYDKAKFRWFEVGGLTINNQPLTINTQGEINVVNAIVTVPQEQWKRINESIHRYEIIDWEELSKQQKTSLFASTGDKVDLSYQRISPTHYKVRVEGISESVTLAFSETYDRLWELRGQESFQLYGLINGFTVWEDGEYDLYFSAQQYVLPGLYLSGLTLIIVSVLLIHSRKKS